MAESVLTSSPRSPLSPSAPRGPGSPCYKKKKIIYTHKSHLLLCNGVLLYSLIYPWSQRSIVSGSSWFAISSWISLIWRYISKKWLVTNHLKAGPFHYRMLHYWSLTLPPFCPYGPGSPFGPGSPCRPWKRTTKKQLQKCLIKTSWSQEPRHRGLHARAVSPYTGTFVYNMTIGLHLNNLTVKNVNRPVVK